MPKQRKNEQVRCIHFTWRLVYRNGTWYADGRSNTPNAGRHIARPRVTGGVRKSTQKRYRTVFDKFIPFATSPGITVWNGVTAQVLTAYVSHLENEGYAHKTLTNELTTLKQAIKWLIKEGHAQGMKPIELKLRKAESQPAYCYRSQEVKAMVELCRTMARLQWLADVISALACTGLRIAEMASLRWADIDLESGRLSLTDETGRVVPHAGRRTGIQGRKATFLPALFLLHLRE